MIDLIGLTMTQQAKIFRLLLLLLPQQRPGDARTATPSVGIYHSFVAELQANACSMIYPWLRSPMKPICLLRSLVLLPSVWNRLQLVVWLPLKLVC